MKTLKKTIVMLFISLLTISCNKDDDNSATPTANYFLKAKVDEIQFEAVAPRVLASKTANRITISAVLPDLRNFELIIDDYLSNPLGSYTIPAPSEASYSCSLKYGDGISSSSIFSANNCCDFDCIFLRGTINITEISITEISGTFSFTGTQTSGTCPRPKKVITEGSFKSGLTQ